MFLQISVMYMLALHQIKSDTTHKPDAMSMEFQDLVSHRGRENPTFTTVKQQAENKCFVCMFLSSGTYMQYSKQLGL
jgi:hypothetical protein